MNRKLNIAFLMDPLETLDLKGDTTFALALEAQRRKHCISFFKPEDLIFSNNDVLANICELELSSSNNLYEFKYHDTFIKPLSKYDVIMMRQDPPFNMAYISATHILEKLPSSTLVVNNPFEVRNSPEKIFVTNFSHLMPKTLISRNIDAIKEFRKKFKNIIIKPLYGNGGQGVFHICLLYTSPSPRDA